MNRIDVKFNQLKKRNKKALITFITAGDPDLQTTQELVLAMESSGADIIELGIPYSDPLADGITIQASSARALKAGAKITNIMSTVKKLREKTQVPLIYLNYYNSVFKYGLEKFIKQCNQSGIDGLIIPDLPLEERSDIIKVCDKFEVYLIPLVAPTSKERIKPITKDGKGFVYCVSVSGVTGTRNKINTNIKEYMTEVSTYTAMPKALGFGISSAEMVKQLGPYCDALIVGSAIIKRIEKSKTPKEAVQNVKSFTLELAKACEL